MAVAYADLDRSRLDLLDENERNTLLSLLDSTVGGETPTEFIARNWPDEPVPPHLMPIIEAVQRAMVMPIRICISVPPGHAKTTILMRLVAWWLSRNPADMCGYLTHSDKQARTKSEIALDGAQRSGVPLRRAKAKARKGAAPTPSLSEWKTDFGGGLVARGIKAGIMGTRIPGLLIIDDPYKDQGEAESDQTNETVKRRLKGMARTRLQGGSIILVHTRYTEDDAIGYASTSLDDGGLGWMLINIPAIAPNPKDYADRDGKLPDDYVGDALGWRKPGDVAWPEKWPLRKCEGPCGHDGHLEEHMDDLELFEAMFQGRPSIAHGGMFKAENFEIVDAAPAGGIEGAGWDLAGTKKKKSAWTVRSKGKIVDETIYILDIVRERWGAEELPDRIAETAETDGVDTIISVPDDGGAAGRALVSFIAKKLGGYDVRWSREEKSKPIRATPYASQVRARNVKLVAGPWVKRFIKEHAQFPRGQFKDQVDATVRMIALLWEIGDGQWVGSSKLVTAEDTTEDADPARRRRPRSDEDDDEDDEDEDAQDRRRRRRDRDDDDDYD